MSAEGISEIRAKFEQELSAHPDLYHPIDVERVRTEEWQVKRFILDQADGDLQKAFAALIKALQWKKSFGVHDRTDQYFPKEIWELNAIEIYGKDKSGRVIQWEAIRNQRTFKEINVLVRQFVVHTMERVDRQSGETGFILVTDANGGGLANVDLDLAKFKIAAIDNYPLGMKAMYIVDQPWLLSAIIRIIIGLMSEKLKKLINFCKGSELLDIMDSQYIPTTLKGTRDKHAFPNDLVSLDKKAVEDKEFDFPLSENFLDNFYNTYKLDRTTHWPDY